MWVIPGLRNRRLGTTAALALVLALAGSTSPATRSDAAGTHDVAALLSGPVVAPEPNASLTVVDPPGTVGTPAPTLEPAVRIGVTGTPVGTTVSADIGDVLLRAYRSAVAAAPVSCHLPVSLLAAIGQVESGSLVGRPIDAQHRTFVIGPVLNGDGFAAIPDTDQGRWDGDPVWDRAVGPMQFIPSTWRTFGVDGDGDGVADPQDIEDASASTAAYFCYGGRDLAQPSELRGAILSYNHSELYLRLVMTYQQRYSKLGLDAGNTVTGLPTSISLVATPAVGRDGWETAQVAAAQQSRSRAHRHATKVAARNRHRAARAGTTASGHHTAPFTGGTPLIQVTPSPPGTPTTPSAPGTPTTPADPGGQSPGPATPTGPDAGDPTGTPTGTPTDPGAPLPPAGCPTAPVTPDPSATPSDVPTAGATTDPLCKPCEPGQTPTPDAPCDPTAPPSEPPTTAPTDGVTTASPSSGP